MTGNLQANCLETRISSHYPMLISTMVRKPCNINISCCTSGWDQCGMWFSANTMWADSCHWCHHNLVYHDNTNHHKLHYAKQYFDIHYSMWLCGIYISCISLLQLKILSATATQKKTFLVWTDMTVNIINKITLLLSRNIYIYIYIVQWLSK